MSKSKTSQLQSGQEEKNNEKKSKKSVLQVIQKTAFLLFVIFGILISLLQLAPRVFGQTPYIVMSDSMSPEYTVGDLVYIKKIAPEKIKIGDVISFKTSSSDTIVTHRVVEIYESEKYFTTKGDANETVDEAVVRYENVVGIVNFSIPVVGYMYILLSWSFGRLVITASILFLILTLYILSELLKLKNSKEKNIENPQMG